MPRVARWSFALLFVVARDASAQPVAPLLDDADAFRAALGDVLYANAEIVAGSARSTARLAIDEEGVSVEFPDGTLRRVTPTDTTAAVEWRLIAAVLARSPLEDALGPFGDVTAVSADRWTVDNSPDAVTGFAVELGTDVFGVTLELGTGRLRQLVAVVDGVRWRLTATTSSRIASGWFFESLRVFRDGIVTVDLTFTDVADQRDNLAPLAVVEIPEPVSPAGPEAIVVPWLPL